MGLPCHTRSDMCESLLGFLPITVEIDIKKLQFLGRLCELDTTHLTKRIFNTRLFSYLLKNDIRHYGFVQDIIPILMKNNLYPALPEYFKSGPPKAQWTRVCTILRHLISLWLQALPHDWWPRFLSIQHSVRGKITKILMGHSEEYPRDCTLRIHCKIMDTPGHLVRPVFCMCKALLECFWTHYYYLSRNVFIS